MKTKLIAAIMALTMSFAFVGQSYGADGFLKTLLGIRIFQEFNSNREARELRQELRFQRLLDQRDRDLRLRLEFERERQFQRVQKVQRIEKVEKVEYVRVRDRHGNVQLLRVRVR